MTSIKVPPLGESIVEATVSRWLKQEGDAVASGETIVELETDKITVEVPALKAGVLVKHLKSEGDVVQVDEALGELDESGAGAAASGGNGTGAAGGGGSPPAAKNTTAAAEPAAQTAAAGSGPAPAGASGGADVKSSPAARRLATEQGVDLAQVAGTGRGGVVSKPDVVEHGKGGQAAAPAKTAPPAPPAPRPAAAPVARTGERESREKLTTRRKRIAENLLQSQRATATLTTFNEIDMSGISSLRERIKARVEKEQGVRLSFMPFFVKAACMALESYPIVNAQIDDDQIVYKHYVNMGIAVASEQGLVVPNLKDADRKGLLDISRDMGDVAKRARDSKLTMDDLVGGTFTITNGGVFGSLISTPIINFPQVAILGLHKIQERPVAIGGKVEVRPMMYVALSYDHRVIDGQQAVLFLVRIKELMEDPATMLIS